MERNSQQQDDPVASEIEHLLETERRGLEALRRSQEHGEHLKAEARKQATAIVNRADARISKLHAAYLQRIDQEIRKLSASQPSGETELKAESHDAIDAAVRRLASRLTGGK